MTHYAAYLTGFFMGTAKFMFAAASMMPFEATYWEIVFCTFFGAFFSFNLFFFFSSLFMEKAKAKRIEKIKNGTYKHKGHFTKLNKSIVKLKLSPVGYFILVIVGPMVLSIPIGSIIIAKFYRRIKLTYWLEMVSLFIWANLFTLANLYMFG